MIHVRQTGVAKEILKTLQPAVFADNQERDEVTNMFLVCRLLGCRPATLLPSISHNVPHEVEATIAALSQHYTEEEDHPNHKNLSNLLQGFYRKAGKVVTCILDTKAEKTKLAFDYACEIEITNVLDVQTTLVLTTKDITTTVECMEQEFRGAGIQGWPALDKEWKGALFGEKQLSASPTKRKASSQMACAAGGAGEKFASKRSQAISAALRQKLNASGGEAKSIGSASSSNNTPTK